MTKRLFQTLFEKAGDTPAPGSEAQTPEQKAAADAAAAAAEANKGKTPEEIAAAEAATAAETARRAGLTPEQREAEDKAKAASEPGAVRAPEKYELKVPSSNPLDAKDLEGFEAFARRMNWTNEEAQVMLDEQIAGVEATLERFKEEAAADPDYGGEKLAETQRLANVVLDAIRPKGHPRRDAFLQILTKGGHVNNIEVLSFLADVGRAASEDGTGAGFGGVKPPKAPLAHRMFPSSAPKQ